MYRDWNTRAVSAMENHRMQDSARLLYRGLRDIQNHVDYVRLSESMANFTTPPEVTPLSVSNKSISFLVNDDVHIQWWSCNGQGLPLYQMAFTFLPRQRKCSHESNKQKRLTHSSLCPNACQMMSAIMLYNLALIMHLTAQHKKDITQLSKALRLYTSSWNLLLEENWHGASKQVSEQLKLVRLAVQNNLGNIYTILGCEIGTEQCIATMHQLLLRSEEIDNAASIHPDSLSSSNIEAHFDFFLRVVQQWETVPARFATAA
jgi:hypothetical protein